MRNSILCLRVLILGVCASIATLSSPAQTQNRILAPLDSSQRISLKGNVSALAKPEFDQGAAPAGEQLTHIRLLLKRSEEQEAALTQFLSDVQNGSSTNYHKWLSPSDFARLYGPAQQDIQSLKSWLESQGLTVEQVTVGNMVIEFSGSVAQVENTFQTSIHTFRINGKDYYSNTTDPKIPQAAASVVAGVAHLNSFAPKSQAIQSGPGRLNVSTGALEAVSDDSTPRVRPNLSYQNSSGTNYLFVVPGDAATIYNTPNSTLNANYSASKAYTGSGVTIGIAADSNIDTTYVSAYRGLFLGDRSAPNITVVGDDPSINSDAMEAYLDTEVSGGLAPGAGIHLYVSKDLFSGMERAISDNTVDILSVSFGGCERSWTSSENTYIYNLWQQAAAQGISVTVSSGDNGSAGCDNPNSVTVASDGFGVNAMASTPFNIAVGGTDYDALQNSFSTYATVPTSASSGAGSASTYYRTAKSWIPENPWNDSTQTIGSYSDNVSYSGSSATIFAGSGGRSSCTTNTTASNSNVLGTCTSGWAKPAWQTGTGVPSDGVRDLPDVSFLAAAGGHGALWLVCQPIVSNNVSHQGCIADSNGSWYFNGVGGTSASAPAFAGMLALVVQATGSRQGQAAQILYSLFNGTHSASIFHDVTAGNISVPCVSGTTDCALNSASNYFLPGYDAATGYDLATGLGSVDVTNLIQYWPTASATATVTATPSAKMVERADSLSIAVSVSGSGTTPSGTVTLSADGYTSSPVTLSAGTATITIPAASLGIGYDALRISYSGDSNYGYASVTVHVTVEFTIPTVTLASASSSVNRWDPMTVGVTVASPKGVPTGTLSLNSNNGGYAISKVTLSNGSASITIPPGSLSGSDGITASYSGDNLFSSAQGYLPVTVNAFTPTLALSAPNTVNKLSSIPITITASGTKGTPTGSVAFSTWSSWSAKATLSNGSATVTIPANALYPGTYTISANYAGDNYYVGGSASASVTVFAASPKVTVTPSAATIYRSSSLSVDVGVSGSAATPTGTVVLSGPGYTSSATVLTNGLATIVIPADSLNAGNDVLTAAYSGDSYYVSTSGSGAVTVNAPAFALSGSTASVNAGASGTSTITLANPNGYAGTVALTCSVTAAPTGASASYYPTCSFNPASVTFSSSTASATSTMSISTTARTTAKNEVSPRDMWQRSGGVLALASVLLLGIPACRRSWKTLLGVIVALILGGGVIGCGGGGGSGGGGIKTAAGTTAGVYTVTVTGTDTANKLTATTTISVTVN